MDSVLVDSQGIHSHIEAGIVNELGGVYEDPGKIGNKWAGGGAENVFRHYLGENLVSEAMECKFQKLSKLTHDDILEIPGAVQFCKKAQEHFNFILASGSDHKFISLVLESLQISQLFPVVVSSYDVEHHKPAPDIFLLAARSINVDPGNCWVLEDSRFGIEAAKRAGMFAVGITTTHSKESLESHGADLVIDSFTELERYVF